ncbi:(d)CMP kinase [Anaeromassilibacillus senegalensis]|uniref:Cytidylate kinase n=1 Tax=Anaeromassilibacillus senegalensis TaxID=1673717 RepID=A0ABS9CKN5_9FIRM|nr:(d)CMP kinase [Anaeromassilibacillus senegalensis]MCF2651498.1 (d)CMP kinase [Anaeromassilibacillus senegalensis]
MFSIAIDGPAGAGKSSVAKEAAKALGFVYVDTGALYRAVALYMLRHGITPSDAEAVEAALPAVTVDLRYEPDGQHVLLCGEDVSDAIRMPEVSTAASDCSAVPAVRKFLFSLQTGMAERYDVLMDGRDIGTVVLPNAQVKIFLTASAEERARRRCRQLKEKGVEADYEKTLREIRERDEQDMNRETAPLKPAEDSVLLDTSELDFRGSVEKLLEIVRERM